MACQRTLRFAAWAAACALFAPPLPAVACEAAPDDTARGQCFFQGDGVSFGAAEAGDGYGNAVTFGDFDGDGLDDLAIGVLREDIGAVVDAGLVQVVHAAPRSVDHPAGLYGRAFGFDEAALGRRAVSAEANFGRALASGDFDGDGIDDLVIGRARNATGGAVIYVVPGVAGTGLALTQARELASGGALLLGFRFAIADFNGDGIDDIAATDDSQVSLWRGPILAGGAPRLPDRSIANPDVIPRLAAGRFGDSRVLLAIGSNILAPRPVEFHDVQAPQTLAGSLVFGDLVEGTEPAASGFGRGLAAGDFDGDGSDEIAIGVPDAGNGVVVARRFLASGAPLAALDDTIIVPKIVAGVPRFGANLLAADLDGDGADELVVALPDQDFVFPPVLIERAGSVSVYAGERRALPLRTLRHRFDLLRPFEEPPGQDDRFGAVIAAGDANGDGRAELAFGVAGHEPASLPDRANAGAVFVRYGEADTLFEDSFEDSP